jgi:hypothetical protein
MSVAVSLESILTVVETLSGSRPFAVDAKARVTHDLLNTEKVLGAGMTPPATKVAAFQKALAAGVATIDLTALVGTNGAAPGRPPLFFRTPVSSPVILATLPLPLTTYTRCVMKRKRVDVPVEKPAWGNGHPRWADQRLTMWERGAI